jgi:glycosyltransferase involved in cell wall biosynthesis
VTELASDDVIVTGYTADLELETLYRSASVIVVPLRYGAGVKGKVVEALRFGIPVVTTSSGAQGLPWAADCLSLADTPEKFAENVVILIKDDSIARQNAFRGLQHIASEFGYRSVVRHLVSDLPELECLLQHRGTLLS